VQGAFKPVIDQCLPFDEIVKAHRRVETGRKRGSVVLLVSTEAEQSLAPQDLAAVL